MTEPQTLTQESITDHLRRIGVKWQTCTLASGNKVIQIRLDKLRVAEGGEWTP